MKSVCIIVLLQLFIVIPGVSQEKEIIVEFELNDQIIEIKNNFEVIFIVDDSLATRITKPKIDGNTFTLPEFKKGTRGVVYFKHRKYELAFADVALARKQSMRWTFGLDRKPFSKDNYAGKEEEEMKDVQLLNYLRLNPREYGDGTVVTNFIPDIKEYRKGIKRLVK